MKLETVDFPVKSSVVNFAFLRSRTDDNEFRHALEDRIETAIGSVHIFPDQIASKGIRIPAPRVVQDLFLQILLNSTPSEITSDTQKLFRKKINAPPPESHSP